VAPPIVTVAQWGATPAPHAFPLARARGLVIHETASPNRAPAGALELEHALALARNIQADHIERGYEDTGEHFTISRGGIILEGRHGSIDAAARGLVPQGAHAGNLEANTSYFGIELEGNYTDPRDAPPAPQWRALVRLTDWLLHRSRLPSSRSTITPHKQWSATGCPGHLTERIPDLARAVQIRSAIRGGLALSAAAGAILLVRAAVSR